MYKSGIYLRQTSPTQVEIKRRCINIKYTKWCKEMRMWVFWKQEQISFKSFERLNKAPCRVLYYYKEKWDYGQTHMGLKKGKEIPQQQYALRKKGIFV